MTTLKMMDIVKERLAMDVDEPVGRAWYLAYRHDVRWLVDRVERLEDALRLTGTAPIDEMEARE